MMGENISWGWLNISGVRGSLEETIHFMNSNNFSFLILGETWLKPTENLRHPSIVFDLRFPSKDPTKGRGIHGLMVVRNAKLTELSDFEEIKRDLTNYSYIWFRFRGMVYGGFYLPPSMELDICIECVQSVSEICEVSGNEDPIFLVGDLNMRLGTLTDDTVTNLRSNIRHTMQELGLLWIRPDSGKWTVCTSRGRSIVDYIFANQEAKKLVLMSKVCKEDYVAGSDHRMLCCTTKLRLSHNRRATPVTTNQQYPTGICRIRKNDIENARIRTAVERKFEERSKKARAAVIKELGPLLRTGHAIIRDEAQKRLDMANKVILDYINKSLVYGGLVARPTRPPSSKPFWDHSLTLIKIERNRHWKAALSHPTGSNEAIFLENAARAAQSRLKKEIRLRKRTSFLAFTEEVTAKPHSEIIRQMSSIRRRLQDPGRIPGPELTPDKLDIYASFFAQIFSSDTRKDFPSDERIAPRKELGLTYQQFLRAVKSMPAGKAPGLDGVTAEILKLGGQALMLVMFPLYRAASIHSCVPSDWNIAALQLIWKAKGRRDDIEKYRPIALTSIFRKVMEKTILDQLQALNSKLDIAQGGFRRGRSTYDLILTLDTIIRNNRRKKKPPWLAFLDIKGAYDSVNRDLLWRKCRRIGIKGGLYDLLISLFDYTSVTIRIRGQVSRKIAMGRGLLQGSLLSPILFNIFIDGLPKLLRRKHPGFPLGISKINSLLYADDIVLIATSQEQLQSMLDSCEQHSKEYEYKFSPSKCEVIAPTNVQASCLRIYGEELKQSPKFKYLGVPVTEMGIDIAGLCYEGISRAMRTANLFYFIGCNGTGFPSTVSRWILASFVRL